MAMAAAMVPYSQVDNEQETMSKEFGCDVMLASLHKELQIIRVGDKITADCEYY